MTRQEVSATPEELHKAFGEFVDMGFKQGYVAGVNYALAAKTHLEEIDGEVTWKDLEEWGVADIINEACEEAKREYLKAVGSK